MKRVLDDKCEVVINSEVSVRSKLRSSSPATAGDGKSIRSSRTRGIQSRRSRCSLVSFPAPFSFFARLSLYNNYGLLLLLVVYVHNRLEAFSGMNIHHSFFNRLITKKL